MHIPEPKPRNSHTLMPKYLVCTKSPQGEDSGNVYVVDEPNENTALRKLVEYGMVGVVVNLDTITTPYKVFRTADEPGDNHKLKGYN